MINTFTACEKKLDISYELFTIEKLLVTTFQL